MLEIQNNQYISRHELSQLSGLSINQIRGQLDYLKKEGMIRRVGAKKGGYWEIIQENETKIVL